MYARLQPRTEWLTSIAELDEDSEVALELFGYLHLDWRVHTHPHWLTATATATSSSEGMLTRACCTVRKAQEVRFTLKTPPTHTHTLSASPSGIRNSNRWL